MKTNKMEAVFILFMVFPVIKGCTDDLLDLATSYRMGYKDVNNVPQQSQFQIDSARSTLTKKYPTGSNVADVQYDCQLSTSSDPYVFMYAIDAATNQKYCLEIGVATRDGNVIFMREIAVNIEYSALGCKTLLEDSSERALIMVKLQANGAVILEGGWPDAIPIATYNLGYRTNSNTFSCTQDKNSDVNVPQGETTSALLNSCSGDPEIYKNTYELVMYMVQHWNSQVFITKAGQKGEGDYLIWMTRGDFGTERLYCVMYCIVESEFTVYLSANVKDEDEAYCEFASNIDCEYYRSNEYVSMKFTSTDCRDGACLNGAGCTQGFGTFTCDCAPGFEGTICDIEIDECASSPCLNGGTCQNGINRWDCDCLDNFIGDRCETEICFVPNTYRKIYAIGYDGGNYLTSEFTEQEILFNSPSNEYLCENDESTACYTASISDIDATTTRRCVKVCQETTNDNNDLVLYQETQDSTRNSRISISTCTASFGDYYIVAYIMTNNPSVNIGNYDIPSLFISGTYQLSFYKHGGNLNCQNVLDCSATFPNNGNQLSMQCSSNCYGGNKNTYENPFETTLYYVGYYTTSNVDGTNGGDPIYVFAFRNNNGHYEFYCGRATQEGIYIYLSLYYNSAEPKCYQNVGSKQRGQNYITIIFTSDRCERDPQNCNSRGNCVNTAIHQYRCDCDQGFTGPNCETDVNDCIGVNCNNGVCLDRVNDYFCDCNPGWSGRHCNEFDYCSENPGTCLNEGTCVNVNNAYRCDCRDGYTGEHCETEINECDPNPCLNCGQCIDRINGYDCNCINGATGGNCQNSPDHCASNPCQNDGTCKNTPPCNGEGYACHCTEDYTGCHCEHPNYCNSNPCANGGECIPYYLWYECQCLDGYTGTHCEQDVGGPCARVECYNGGTCYPADDDKTVCVCASGFTGEYCLKEKDDDDLDDISILIIVLFVVFLIVALALGAFMFMRNKKLQ